MLRRRRHKTSFEKLSVRVQLAATGWQHKAMKGFPPGVRGEVEMMESAVWRAARRFLSLSEGERDTTH